MRLFRRTDSHPLRRRLWLGGTWLGLAVATTLFMLVVSSLADRTGVLSLGGDFVPAYAAGTLVRQGRAIEVYDQAALAQVERRIVAEAGLDPLPFYGFYLNPPFFAAAYAPLSALPYRAAAVVWLAINLLCLAGALLLLVRMLPASANWRFWGLVPLLVLISMPFCQSICHLQNTCLSLLLVSGVVTCWRIEPQTGGPRGWRKNWPALAAGLICGLLFYKPQLACAIAAMLCLTRGWRVAAGCCITGSSLLLLTLVKLPGTIAAYVRCLPALTQQIQNRPTYNWGRQATLRGFWRLLLQGHQGGADLLSVKFLTALGMAAGLAALGMAAWLFVRSKAASRSPDRLIAATIAAMPLLMPYFMDYDLLLLAIPAVLLAGEWIRFGAPPLATDRFLAAAWSVLFVMLYLNPGISGPTRLNFAAALVALVAGTTIARCMSKNVSRTNLADQPFPPIALAA